MKKVLIVDDELHVQASVSYIVKQAGYQVLTADNGEDAIERAYAEKPDLIILDIMMPQKNGFEVCQAIRQNKELKDAYIILLTARGQDSDVELGLKLGANEYLTKPFSPIRLQKRIKELLDS